MNYKKKVTIQFPDAECSFTPHWGWCIYETFDTILPLHRLGCGNNISQAWQDAFNKHCKPSRMPVDDEQPEVNSVPFGYIQEVGLPNQTTIITTTQPDTDTPSDNITF